MTPILSIGERIRAGKRPPLPNPLLPRMRGDEPHAAGFGSQCVCQSEWRPPRTHSRFGQFAGHLCLVLRQFMRVRSGSAESVSACAADKRAMTADRIGAHAPDRHIRSEIMRLDAAETRRSRGLLWPACCYPRFPDTSHRGSNRAGMEAEHRLTTRSDAARMFLALKNGTG